MPVSVSSVGIVLRTRDRPLFVGRALRSVLAQTHPDWHVVLVNDGGDPEVLGRTVRAVAMPPGRITRIDHPASVGRAAAFNRGLAALETDLVACLDDDDTWDPAFLAELVALRAANAALMPDLGGVAAGVTALKEEVVTDPDGRERIVPLGEDGLPNAFRRTDFVLGPIAYATYRHDIYPVQWVLDRQAVADLGGFPEAFEVMEDRAFLLRFLQHWRVITLNRPLAFHHRRARRVEDTSQSAQMNTLDNPSYDWRRFSDLALPSLASPPGGPAADLPGLVRAVGASVVRELNEETSALWHKVNGEAQALAARLDRLEAKVSGRAAPPDAVPTGHGAVWSLWPAVGVQGAGYALAPATPFLERLALSFAGPATGLLFHADPAAREAVVQVPATGDWCALELRLDGLVSAGGGLAVDLVVGLSGGALFETALMLAERAGIGRVRHVAVEGHVHSAPADTLVRVARVFGADVLARGTQPKLSIILPRQATNLRLILHDLVVAPV